ncbi:unnamed protein product [Brachionus calyciflorus]|uniref:Glutamate receptor 1 n=1 Tax=Brachionus calyciflorus TaxID=104777 RepID=A0A813QM55_9BILA|nr:unnamed protein product [Brachionus calyciflorus]
MKYWNHSIRYFLAVTYIVSFALARREQKIFKISVFYDDSFENIEDLISYSVDSVNRVFRQSRFQFEYSAFKVEKTKTFKLTKKFCQDIEDGRLAILAIGDNSAYRLIDSIANSLNIPYIEIKWNSLDEEYTLISMLMQKNQDESLPKTNKVNIHPPANKLMKAIIDIIDKFKWESVTILFQESSGLSRLEDLIKLPRNSTSTNEFHNQNILSNKLRVHVKKLSSDVSLWPVLIHDAKLSGSSHIIVDLSTKYLNKFIQLAEDTGLMTTYFHYLFTSLDISIFEHTPSANVTAFQVFEPGDALLRNIFAEYNLKNMVSHKPMFKYMPSIAVFIHDAFMLIGKTIEQKNLFEMIPESPKASCETETPWNFGQKFMEYLKKTKFVGLSGNIEFDRATGYRTNLTLSIIDKNKSGVELVGFWRDKNTSNPVDIVRSYAKEKDRIMDKLNRNLIVTTKIEAPYVMIKTPKNNQTLEGNDKYQGYCVDLLVKISKICGFNYTIRPVADGVHGTLVDGKWNGIINELIEKKADIAVAGLTITFQREQAIDFTKPFLNLGISILYKRQQKIDPNIFSFLSPLSIEIWLYIIAAYLIVSILLFVLSRFSPYEWKNPYPCKKESELVENQFTLANSLWFTIGSLMKQGSDINPKSFSARILTGAWWFFALIMISSYTANLAAFLTTKRLSSPIEDVEGLSKQSEIKYGCLNGGSTQQFFRESKIHTYERMWNFMNSMPDVFVKSTEEGIERVKKGGFAYLLESTTNDFLRQRDCELMQVGGLIDTKGYGIGTPPGSPWRDQISNAILQLQEKGDLQELYIKWWEKEGKDPNHKCEKFDDKKKDSASELSLANVGGIFVVLSVGLILSFLVAILEFYWKTRQHPKEKGNLKRKFMNDLKFAAFKHKPVKRSSLVKMLDLNNEIKLVALEDKESQRKRHLSSFGHKESKIRLLAEQPAHMKFSNSVNFDRLQSSNKTKAKKSKSFLVQNGNINGVNLESQQLPSLYVRQSRYDKRNTNKQMCYYYNRMDLSYKSDYEDDISTNIENEKFEF